MKRVKFIYNPASGNNRIRYELDQVISVYQRHGYILEPYHITFGPQDRTMLESVDSSYDHIVVSGGDGTINYIVNLLMRSGNRHPVSFLPTGTANDFAMLLGISSSVEKACEENLTGAVVPVDIGKVNDQYFVNVFSCGLFTDISQRTPTLLKNTFGKLAYYFSSIGELPNFRKIDVVVRSEGEEVYRGNALILFVFNGKTAGNIPIAYLSDVRDGLLDLMIVKGGNIVESIRTVFHYFRKGSDKYPKELLHIRSREIEIESERSESTDMDGQPGPSFPIRIQCLHNALNVRVPSRFLEP